eukprot:NODE_807_length_1172_cov_392.899377_g365_i1.p1 GENE.NODE_807_length_1172_cov_392.899377_g365_i1~~NODE_807_length_1172_cov_392.899377_g365_i1.p1  ORF type:complete len:167 (-),score=74.51 NODE_807_length_1172_cov_392.899377_g365_i1:116-616(-)
MESWPEMKASTPFGKLPIMQDGDVTLAQSVAIAAYIGRRAGMLGSTDEDFGTSWMLTMQVEDIFTEFAKHYYGANKDADCAKYFEEAGPNAVQQLENLCRGDRFTSSLTMGELSIFCLLNLFLDMYPDLLEHYPKLNVFYNRIAAQPKVAKFLENMDFVQWYNKTW